MSTLIILLCALGFFLLLGIGVPLYIILLALSALLFNVGDIPLAAMVVSFKRLEVQEFLSAIPLFTYAGYALSRSEVPRRIMVLATAWLGWFRGSATAITVVVMALFTALTGASGVSILALGSLMYPLLIKASRNEHFSYGLIAGSGSIGLLLAPSLPVIIYGIISNQNASAFNRINIDMLFQAALLPSAIMFALYIGYGMWIERQTAAPSHDKPLTAAAAALAPQKFSLPQALKALVTARWELPLPFLIYGGIYWGFLTVLDASLIAFLYTFVLLFFIRRECHFKKDFIPLMIGSLRLSGGIFIIMASAFILTNYLVNERIPEQIFTFLAPILTHPYLFLLAVNVFLLLTGCILDIFSAILIVLPLVLPLAERYGINAYHFAIIFLVNLEIGYLTPPIGLNLFIASYRFKKDILFIYRAALPFLFLLVSALFLLSYFPQLSTFTLNKSTTASIHSSSQDPAATPTPGAANANATQPPPLLSGLRVKQTTATTLTIAFTPPASAPTANPTALFQYKLFYIDEDLADSSLIYDLGEEVVFTEQDVQIDGAEGTLTLTGLVADTLYTFIVLTTNAVGTESFPSTPLMATTQTAN